MIRSGRHPHEVAFLGVFAIAGIAGLVAPHRTSNAVLQSLPAWGLTVFYLVLAVGSLLALAGVLMPGLKGPLIELYGLLILSGELLGYGVAILGYAGPRALLSALLPIGIGIANVIRMRQITREVREARAGAKATRTERHVEGS